MGVETLQTLERGLFALEKIAQKNGQLNVAQLAEELQINRTIAYRIVRTLSHMQYIQQNEKQMLELSSKVLHLSQCFEKSIPSNSQRVLDELSLITQASAALVIAEGADCVVIKSSQNYNPILQIKYQIGSRHPIGLAATGKVIAATYPSHVDETEEIQRVSQQGYAYSKDALQVGTAGLFMPLPHRHMAVGIVKLGDIELETSLIALKKAVLQLQS